MTSLSLAALGILVSSYILISAAFALQDRTNTTFLIPKHMLDDSNAFSFHQWGKCFGSIHTTFGVEGNYLTYTVRGSLRVSVNESAHETALSGLAQFNSLNQILGSHITARSSERTVELGTLGVNPMTLSVREKTAKESRSFKINIPGPVTLMEVDDMHYQLLYEPAALPPLFEEFEQNPILQTFGISVLPGDCEPEALSALQLDMLYNFLKKFNKAFN